MENCDHWSWGFWLFATVVVILYFLEDHPEIFKRKKIEKGDK